MALLGNKVLNLANVTKNMDSPQKQKLEASGFKPGAVKELTKMISKLAKLRRESYSAHGGPVILEATYEEAQEAEKVAADILSKCVPNLKSVKS